MTILDGLFMGIIQGLTEFLPVSSSGHLSLYQYIFGTGAEGGLFFSLMLHLGTLASVVVAYYEDLWKMAKEVVMLCKELFSGQFTFKTDNTHRKLLYMLFFACLPLFLILPINQLVSNVSSDSDIVVEGVCFLVTAGLLFLACKAPKGKAGIRSMKPMHAMIIGVFQAVASFPGISRSGATISSGLVMGFNREIMVKFSFLLGIPAIIGGVVFEISDAVAENAEVQFLPLVVGVLASAVVGYGAIRLIGYLVLSNKFVIFAWYTLILGIIVIVMGIIGHVAGWGDGMSASSEMASSVAASVASTSDSVSQISSTVAA